MSSAPTEHLSPTDQVAAWLNAYDTPSTDVVELICDRHDPAATAFTFVDTDLNCRDLTYGELAERSRKMATVLSEVGVRTGDRVPVLLNKSQDLIVILVALWRLGAVHVPLFTAFASGAIEVRVSGSAATLVITEESQAFKLEQLTGFETLLIGAELDARVAAAEPLAENVAVGGTGIMLQLFTSGTTGKPKGVPVAARALAAFHSYLHYSLDVSADDVFWNAADPGWAYGLYYGILAPMVGGRANIVFEGGFTPDSTVAVMKKLGVTNFAGAPTMYRAMSKSGAIDGVRLRRASSAGEPLTPDVIDWAVEVLGCEVRDQYGQTETGMTICNNWHPDAAGVLKPGSMGKGMPGYTAGVVDGEIALNVDESPLLWFTGYHEAPEKTAERFTTGPDGKQWYLTADTGHIDEDGYLFFTARDDDVILAAGYRIGPFDVESSLVKHDAVADVAVVGRPDPEGVRGEQVEAFVVLAEGVEATEALAEELKKLVREDYSKHAYPRRVHFVDTLPKTPSGKVQRYILRDLP